MAPNGYTGEQLPPEKGLDPGEELAVIRSGPDFPDGTDAEGFRGGTARMENAAAESPNRHEQDFIGSFAVMQRLVHDWAERKGWNEKYAMGSKIAGNSSDLGDIVDEVERLVVGNDIALMQSELSEALEGLRHGNPLSDKIGDHGFTALEEEFADTIVRIMHTSQALGLRVAQAFVAKMAYNEKRPYKHGKLL